MKANEMAAEQLLGMDEREIPLTAAAVAQAANIHQTTASECLRMWAAAGWLEKRQEERAWIYSITEKGRAGLGKLIREANLDCD
jgi:predicted transcriptional regulator